MASCTDLVTAIIVTTICFLVKPGPGKAKRHKLHKRILARARKARHRASGYKGRLRGSHFAHRHRQPRRRVAGRVQEKPSRGTQATITKALRAPGVLQPPHTTARADAIKNATSTLFKVFCLGFLVLTSGVLSVSPFEGTSGSCMGLASDTSGQDIVQTSRQECNGTVETGCSYTSDTDDPWCSVLDASAYSTRGGQESGTFADEGGVRRLHHRHCRTSWAHAGEVHGCHASFRTM